MTTPENQPKTCPICYGTGYIPEWVDWSLEGTTIGVSYKPCTQCHGKGEIRPKTTANVPNDTQ
jgi:DnaJ-class molecular chaperone